ncbi:MAG: NfeD family protein [Conexivisphaera sp.]
MSGSRALIWICALIGLTVVLSASNPTSLHASGGANRPVVIIDMGYTVDLGSSTLVRNAVEYAISHRAGAILMEMNSPGGYLDDMASIISYLNQANQSGIPIYTYVLPGGLAASAASYIAMDSNVILMGPGSELGPSTPIVLGGSQLEQNHTEAAMLSLMESEAARWNRNSTAASYMVLYDTSYTAQQAVQYHLADGTAENLSAAESYLGISGAPHVQFSEGYYEQFLSVISDPLIDGILMMLGLILVALDVLHPTIIMSAAGAVSLVMGLVGAELVGASAIGLVLIAASAALLILELKTGHGLAFLAAVLVGVVGIYMLGQGMQVSPSPYGLDFYVAAAAISVGGAALAIYARSLSRYRRRPLTGRESLVGVVGIVTRELNPCGEVRIEGFIWRACSEEGRIRRGDEVLVTGYDGLQLKVRRAEQRNSGR